MRQNTLGIRLRSPTILLVLVLMLWHDTSFAAPALGANCGAGATISGSDLAGKVTIGAGTVSVCALTFASAFANAPACTGMNEGSGGRPGPVGAKSTTTTLLLDGTARNGSLAEGDVISYICVTY